MVVEAYDGLLEHLTDEPEELAASAGLGLPLEELAQVLGCSVTLLDWREWLRYERRPSAFTNWVEFPGTRPVAAPERPRSDQSWAGVDRRSIPDPAAALPDASGLGLGSLGLGLLANSDPLFLASYVLDRELEALDREHRIDAVLLPMWGGSGYVPQMSRATGAGLAHARFAVVVTDTSARRHGVNGEGAWTRPAITRRQMEDLSLALADLVVCFGPRGEAIARQGRSRGPVVTAPRRVDAGLIENIAARAEPRGAGDEIAFSMAEPLQCASGSMVMLDAANILRRRGAVLDGPILCGGADMSFAPQSPRHFRDYWSGRGWVRELIAEDRWRWSEPAAAERPPGAVRVYPSPFEHLPEVWSELARGGFPVLSPAAAEGLAPGAKLPEEALLGAEPSAELVADHLQGLQQQGPEALEQARARLCAAVAEAYGGKERQRLLDDTAGALESLLRGEGERAGLGDAARLLLDRRRPPAQAPKPGPAASPPAQSRLTVVVVCYEMGQLVVETVCSVWASDLVPDELILVDDGSFGAETLQAIAQLEAEAVAGQRPLRVLRQSNRGLAAARNAGLEAATGELISFLDGDDLIGPTFYRLAREILIGNPGLGGVAAWAELFGEGVPDGFWNAPQPELPLLLVENTVFVPLMMPTTLLRELGGYDTAQRYNYEDWELSVRLLAQGRPIVTIPRYLQRYRVRQDSLYRTMSPTQNQVMRELFLERHRAVVERFAPEVAMMVEHELMRLKDRQAKTAPAPAPELVAGTRMRGLFRLLTGER